MVIADEGKDEVLVAIFSKDCGSLVAGKSTTINSILCSAFFRLFVFTEFTVNFFRLRLRARASVSPAAREALHHHSVPLLLFEFIWV